MAVTLPAVLAILSIAVSAVGLAGDQAWLTSSAGWAARSIAIGGSTEQVTSTLTTQRPGVEVDVSFDDDDVCVRLSRRASGPLDVFRVHATGLGCARRVL